MEFLVTIINWTLFAGLLISPILLLLYINQTNIKNKLIAYVTIGILLMSIITVVFAWWAYTSDLVLLKHYGYNIDGMSETEFYAKVSPANMNKVKSLETNITGIGWPLKAILTFIFYTPYLLIVYGLTYFIKKGIQL